MNTPTPKTPFIVAILGYGGLIPFVLPAIAPFLGIAPDLPWLQMQLAYGAIILSFLGGLHWAFAMTCKELSEQDKSLRFVWSVIPSLAAWSTFAMSPKLAAIVLIAGFTFHLLQDIWLVTKVQLPEWFMRLRFQLTAVACISLANSTFFTK